MSEDIEQIYKTIQFNQTVNIIDEFSYNYKTDFSNYKLINIGNCPINVHNIGIYFRNFFDYNLNSDEHHFQTLTDSNKSSNAFRTYIFI